jgi:hypothetical protein
MEGVKEVMQTNFIEIFDIVVLALLHSKRSCPKMFCHLTGTGPSLHLKQPARGNLARLSMNHGSKIGVDFNLAAKSDSKPKKASNTRYWMPTCAPIHSRGRVKLLLRFVFLGATAYLPVNEAFAPVSLRLGENANLRGSSGGLSRLSACEKMVQYSTSKKNEGSTLSRMGSHVHSQEGINSAQMPVRPEPSKGDADGNRRSFMTYAGKLLSTLPLLSTTTTVFAATVEGRCFFPGMVGMCSYFPPKSRRENVMWHGCCVSRTAHQWCQDPPCWFTRRQERQHAEEREKDINDMILSGKPFSPKIK